MDPSPEKKTWCSPLPTPLLQFSSCAFRSFYYSPVGWRSLQSRGDSISSLHISLLYSLFTVHFSSVCNTDNTFIHSQHPPSFTYTKPHINTHYHSNNQDAHRNHTLFPLSFEHFPLSRPRPSRWLLDCKLRTPHSPTLWSDRQPWCTCKSCSCCIWRNSFQ